MMAEEERFLLHESVFHDDIRRVAQLLRSHDIAQRDHHGNTPLHLAVMMGHKECVHLLLAHGAPVKVKNALGWSPLAESVSYGDRQIILILLRKLKQQSREALEERRPALVSALHELGDFYLELKWDFQSWVPLVSRILPSDVCRIWKRGPNIRMDTTLVDFNDMKWERGDISFIFTGEAKPANSLTVLDNKLQVFQSIRYEESDLELEDEVDILMSSDIMAAQMSTKKISFSRAQRGWFFREERSEIVGSFQADFYTVHGLALESRKRREHLSPEDLQKNKQIMENLSKGNIIDNYEHIQRRPSLRPPPETSVTWEEYLNAEPGRPPTLGRRMLCKENAKTFKATLAMSEEFPMTIEALLDVLEIIAPFKHFSKLREFMITKLPPGFPVKIEIPVFPTVTARVTFQEFDWMHDIGDEKFMIPKDYTEDPNRFPDL
ncbi:ankyrin repeat domain-containing protein 13C-B [Lingula anatina]|uniref:Ankyrin repeat domain-containing protein 13C-B n=1 Tax=Lingula anatina TaxID=7574 RepID=A0A1S3JFP8_LINAN|nr:ankyrin repeat domain-containing protein 13C-B [Lingula anatina]|eukprot:XP_013408976.1 ankyrin repeat domain-containing protein 13C-B [Lingula anatina]